MPQSHCEVMATDFNTEMAVVGEKYLIHLYLRNIWVLKKLLKCHIDDLKKKNSPYCHEPNISETMETLSFHNII